MSVRTRNERALLAWVALVSLALASLGAAKRDLYEFCDSLRGKLAGKRAVKTDAEAALNEAQKYMHSSISFSKGSRYKLSKAWMAVVRGESCNAQSADHVAVIDQCSPDRNSELATLYLAVREYSNRCLTPHFWDERLRRTLQPEPVLVQTEDKSSLEWFLNDQFIENYRRNNPAEDQLSVFTINGRVCCKPQHSRDALLARLAPIFRVQTERDVLNSIKKDRKPLEEALERHLFKPCASYVSSLETLMRQASRASNYHVRFSQAFFDGLSSEFRNAIFRFKYCATFRDLKTRDDKLYELNLL